MVTTSISDHISVGIVSDISKNGVVESFKAMFERQVLDKDGVSQPRMLPTVCCYSETGAKLYSDSLRLPTTYTQREEAQILSSRTVEICEHIVDGSHLIDLGAGDATKTIILLDFLESKHKIINYWAVDIVKDFLEEVVGSLAQTYHYVQCRGLLGTYDDAATWSQSIHGPKVFMSLGHQLGNDAFEGAVSRLSMFSKVMNVGTDKLLLGMDVNTSADVVLANYDLEHECIREFIRGGARHSNNLLGHQWYRDEDWDLFQRVEKRGSSLEHRFVFKALEATKCEPIGTCFAIGDEIFCFEAYAYDRERMDQQFQTAGLTVQQVFKSGKGLYDLYVLET